jgi:serralysin
MSYAPQSVIDAVYSGKNWGTIGQPATLTYCFLGEVPSYYGSPGTEEYPNGFQELTGEQQLAVFASFAFWSNVANVTFVEELNPDLSQLTFGRYDIPIIDGVEVFGVVFEPGSDLTAGDVWFTTGPGMENLLPGTEALATVTHEIGHAIGLRHPFGIANGSASSDFFTVMSYTQYDPNETFWAYKPMLWDIAVAQYLYGANIAYANGPNTYSWTNSTQDFQAIWDAGGTDTIDASQTTTDNYIDLQPGSASTIGRSDGVDNLNLAYLWNSNGQDYGWIENAIGGAGIDVLVGNAVANVLQGNGGNDHIRGGDGADTLHGERASGTLNGQAGNDTLDGGVVADAGTGIIPKGQGDNAVDTLIGGAGDDTYVLRGVGSGVGGVDEITDSEGSNRLVFHNGQDLPVASALWAARDAAGASSWTNPLPDGATFSLSAGILTGNVPIVYALGQTVTVTFKINGWVSANHQVLLLDPFALPETTNTINAVDYEDDETIYDTAASDLILGDARDNPINASTGGSNWIQAGAGRDFVVALTFLPDDAHIIEGGAGDDVLTGGAGNDQLYADVRVDWAQAISAGNGAGSGLHGDWLSGGWGDDVLVGDVSNDGFAAGMGKDLVIAGAGDDNIFGDADWVATTIDWFYVDDPVTNTRTFHTFNGNENYDVGDADIIYAGSGIDYVWAGGGDDLVWGELGNDQLIGQSGSDMLLGGEGDDRLVGSESWMRHRRNSASAGFRSTRAQGRHRCARSVSARSGATTTAMVARGTAT